MNLQIYEEATQWLVQHRDGGLDANQKSAFDRWLRESPQHVRAYLEMSSVWEGIPALGSDRNPTADELVARARSDDNVVAHEFRPQPSASLSPSLADHGAPTITQQRVDVPAARTRSRLALYGLAATVLIAVCGAWLYSNRGAYATETGEQRSLMLADGSTVELNARSRIKVSYTAEERHIDLLEGQALFHVAKNKARPFVVQTGATRVRAVGTAFDVNKTRSGAVVTVVEGRVAVHTEQGSHHEAVGATPASSPPIPQATDRFAGGAPPALHVGPGEVLLGAGEQLVVTSTSVAEPTQANITAATAWTRRSLIFDSSPLPRVAEEFNRYNTRRLVIEDPQLDDFHISGVFSSAEPTLFLRFLQAQPELVVEETEKEIRVRKR